MKKYTLDNGLIAYYYPLEQAYSAAIGLYINIGARDETPQISGITHLMEHLHFRRLGELSQRELYHEMDVIGGELRATTYKEMLRFYMKIRPVYYEKALVFFEKVISMYDWSSEDVEAEKQVVLNELYEREECSPIDTISNKLVWKDTPLSMRIIGVEKAIRKITVKDIIEYKKQAFSKGNVVLVVTGGITEWDIARTNEMFSKLSLTERTQPRAAINTSRAKRQPDIEIVDCAWNSAEVRLTFDIDKKIEQSNIILLNSILGGGTGARLQYELREKKGLTANIYSDAEIYSDAAAITISFSTPTNNIYSCMKSIVSVLNELKRNITDEDMNENLPYFTENLWYAMESAEQLNADIGWAVFQSKEPQDIPQKISIYKQIIKEDLTNAAATIFAAKNASFVMMGEADGISKDVVETILNRLDLRTAEN